LRAATRLRICCRSPPSSVIVTFAVAIPRDRPRNGSPRAVAPPRCRLECPAPGVALAATPTRPPPPPGLKRARCNLEQCGDFVLGDAFELGPSADHPDPGGTK
jgi:hypothetical protein